MAALVITFMRAEVIMVGLWFRAKATKRGGAKRP
jgi:hypothetical protein